MRPRFFRTPEELRAWFADHHDSEEELWVGFYKKDAGQPSITWAQAVDEALCVGWIDGIRKRIDEESYTNRFTPRRSGSTWSAINIRRVGELEKEGRMQPRGLAAFARRTENKSGIYSYEQRPQELPEPYAAPFKKNKKAWAFFQSMPPGYRKQTIWWVVSAKQEVTRRIRLRTLIDQCARGIDRRRAVTPPSTKAARRKSNHA